MTELTEQVGKWFDMKLEMLAGDPESFLSIYHVSGSIG